MKLPLQITVRNASVSDVVKNEIRDRAVKLEQFSNNIMGCRVTVDSPHRHQHQGMQYAVQIDLTVRGFELVVKRQPHEDIYVAVRDAFDAARRRLEGYECRLRGEVKNHEAPSLARVSKLFQDEGYGFLETPDGYEVYFHRNSVLGDAYDRLTVGSEVRFVEEEGEKGPQASTVEVFRKHRGREEKAGPEAGEGTS
ncbi:MAG: HPF/RaiA family ribosome-associated protein [Nitrospirae bacterium]|nr:HPF/RaiA family ribosome-associated protein [Nitrospirota bacterium]